MGEVTTTVRICDSCNNDLGKENGDIYIPRKQGIRYATYLFCNGNCLLAWLNKRLKEIL